MFDTTNPVIINQVFVKKGVVYPKMYNIAYSLLTSLRISEIY